MRLYTPTHDERFNAFIDFMEGRPGFDATNYGTSAAYNTDKSRSYRHLVRARKALFRAELLGYNEEVMMDALRHAFSGRLSLVKGSLIYCTGQYWPTEFRLACANVLEYYVYRMKLKEQKNG